MGSCSSAFLFSTVTESKVYRPCHLWLNRVTPVLAADQIVLSVTMCWLIRSGCWPLTFLLCFPHRGPVTYSGVEVLVAWGRWPFPALLTFAWVEHCDLCQSTTLFWALKANAPLWSWHRPQKETTLQRDTRRRQKTGMLLHAARVQWCVKAFVALLPCVLIHISNIVFTLQPSKYYRKLKIQFPLTEGEMEKTGFIFVNNVY